MVSALVFPHGSVSALRAAWRSRSVVPLVSTHTLRELVRVFSYPKFRLDGTEQLELLSDYVPYAEVIDVPEAVDAPACRDRNDQPFIELAVHAQADAIVTGDTDIHDLSTRLPCPVWTPDEFSARHNS